MRKARTMSSKTKTKLTSKAQLMQLLKFKVIEWEAAQDLLDEQMQQTEAATDLRELVDEIRQQKAEFDRMCNELIEQQLVDTRRVRHCCCRVCTEKLQMAENQTKS